MMRIAILGATSQIAKDLIFSFFHKSESNLVLYGRDLSRVQKWLKQVGINERYKVSKFDDFCVDEPFDAVINFIGTGDPARTVAMGSSIFEVTQKYDNLALDYLKAHPTCRYLFLSSGAAYGSNFENPVDLEARATIDINNFRPQDFYSVAKLYSECRHRSLHEFSIVDIRIFNYFSRTQDMSARFLITDIVRAIREKVLLKTSADSIVRDFLHPSDFYCLVNSIISSPPANAVVDCFSKAPIEKLTLLSALHDRFALQYEFSNTDAGVNATGDKPFYYSNNRSAEKFGYTPHLTALEGVIMEIDAYMKEVNSHLSGNYSNE